jgi:hypothetical protein
MDGCGDLRSYVDNIISIPIKNFRKWNIPDSNIEDIYDQVNKIFSDISSIEYVYGIFETYSEKADKYDGGETTYYVAGENTKSVKDYVDHHIRIFGRRIDYIHLECLTNTEMKYASVIYHGGWGEDLVEQRMSRILDLEKSERYLDDVENELDNNQRIIESSNYNLIKLDELELSNHLNRFLALCKFMNTLPYYHINEHGAVVLAIFNPKLNKSDECDDVNKFYKKIENDIMGDTNKFLIIKSLEYEVVEIESTLYLLFYGLNVSLSDIKSQPVNILNLDVEFNNLKSNEELESD